jgi:hypothetical protein
MNTVERMVEEIRAELSQGEDLDTIKDRSGEFIDSWLPIYNNQIIQEWTLMPNDYTDRGSAELGVGGEVNIINLMSLDLYLYYSDLFNEAVAEVEETLEGAE